MDLTISYDTAYVDGIRRVDNPFGTLRAYTSWFVVEIEPLRESRETSFESYAWLYTLGVF